MSYNIESLFTNVPIAETFEYIPDETYVRNKLPKLLQSSDFTESTYMFNSKLYK